MTKNNMAASAVGSNGLKHTNSTSEAVDQAVIDLNDPAQLRTLLAAYADRAETAEKRLSIAEPKATAFDEFLSREGEVSVEDAAKMVLGWSGVMLFRRLREAGWLKRDGSNKPKLWAIEKGLMTIRPRILYDGRVYTQPMFTPKGLNALRLAVRGNDLFLAIHV